MRPEITTLANGLRVVSHTMPHLETFALGLWVGAGARHETLPEHGISHLLEHMAFKGTARRTARRIAEEIEEAGGGINAATGLESTAYFARALKGAEAVVLDIMADILQNSLLSEEDLTRERDVILQEIAGIADSPEELVFELAQNAAFPDQAVGRPIIGTPDSIARLGARELGNFLAEHYTAPRIVLAAAGAIVHDTLVRHAEALFGGFKPGAECTAEPARYAGGSRASEKPFEQCHLVLNFAGPSYLDPHFYTAQIFSGLFGGSASSRLFQEVRENRGLCYAISSTAWGLADAGIFGIHAATGTKAMGELVDVIGHELTKAASQRPGEAEVARAKAQFKAGTLMSLESSSARTEQMASQLLALGRLIPREETVARIDAVTPEAVRALAERVVTGAPPTAAVVGAGRRSQQYAEQAARLGAD
ncbi:MAG: M16 family metallopeptidase [Hyphomicrobiaceae bacterium]